MSNIILHASDLYSKWGFQDGDLLMDTQFDEQLEKMDDHKALESLIREFLLPALPDPVEIEFYESIHNPVRAADWPEGAISEANASVSVEVPHAKVLDALRVSGVTE